MLRSKFLGCMIGSAVGDSIGVSIGKFVTEKEKVKIRLGRWTDDTHMMIGVAESLIINRGFNGEHMAYTFMRNYEMEPWRGYARGPPRVFRLIRSGLSWSEASKHLFGGMGSYGNGAAMRVAPVGLLYYDNPETLRSVAYEQSRITHAHPLGMEGAAIQAYAIALAVKSDPSRSLNPPDFLEELMNFTNNDVYRMKLKRIGDLLSVEADKLTIIKELGNGVEAHNSVPTAIYSFLKNADNFKDSVLYAISLGGDTDTIGAMTGAISGAYHGIEAIPEDWKRDLERREYIENLAERLWEIKSTLKSHLRP